MNSTLVKAMAGLAPAIILFSGSVVLFCRRKTTSSFLQLLGAGGIVLVVVAHICEALRLFPWMHWGLEHSIGHYFDLSSVILALMFFPLGYLLHAINTRPS